ncbi:hypothetical protein Tco_0537492, partial [Tanacetum coccineum]
MGSLDRLAIDGPSLGILVIDGPSLETPLLSSELSEVFPARIYTLPFDLNNSMDKSWMRTSRTKKQYIDGVDAFINYTKWDKHGEKDEQEKTAQIPVNVTTEFVDDIDFDMDFGSKYPTVEMVNATKESFDDLAKFQELLLDAEKPLYKGCHDFTKLSAIVKLLNLKGISADGVNVKSGTRHHSVWPVLSIIYNLPPWLCMKRKFIMLSVLILGYPGNDIDVFLEPLVDDLHT